MLVIVVVSVGKLDIMAWVRVEGGMESKRWERRIESGKDASGKAKGKEKGERKRSNSVDKVIN